MSTPIETLHVPLGLFGPFSWLELVVVFMAALMVFGSRLPEVALRAVAHVMRARRAVSKMWRDTGLEDELRRVRRDIELNLPREADFDVRPRTTDDARAAAERAREAAKRSAADAKARIEPGASPDGLAGDGLAGDGPTGEGLAGDEAIDYHADYGLEHGDDAVDPDASRASEIRLEPAEGVVARDDYLSSAQEPAGSPDAGDTGPAPSDDTSNAGDGSSHREPA